MKLLIDIDEKIYNDLRNRGLTGMLTAKECECMNKAIYNGTPLPKGHGRLIDADAYKEKVLRKFPCNDRDDSNIRRLTEMAILNAPTIIESDKEK